MVKFFDYVTSGVRELTSNDFIQALNGQVLLSHPDSKEKHGIIMFYLPWCERSKSFRQLWSDLAQAGGQQFLYMAVNCNEQPGISRALQIQGYPTFKVFYPDGSMKTYNGVRTAQGFNTMMCQLMQIDTSQGNSEYAKYFHYKLPVQADSLNLFKHNENKNTIKNKEVKKKKLKLIKLKPPTIF